MSENEVNLDAIKADLDNSMREVKERSMAEIDSLNRAIESGRATIITYRDLIYHYSRLDVDKKFFNAKYNEAVNFINDEINRGITITPSFTYMLLAEIHTTAKNKKLAKQSYDTALSFGENTVQILSSRASSNTLFDDYAANYEIIYALSRIIEQEPNNIDAYMARAEVGTGKLSIFNENTISDFEKVIELSDDEELKEYLRSQIESLRQLKTYIATKNPYSWLIIVLVIIGVIYVIASDLIPFFSYFFGK